MPPAGNGESVTDLTERLTKTVRAHTDAAPFTLQRLAELLLEPQKQYARLDKLVRPLIHTFAIQPLICAREISKLVMQCMPACLAACKDCIYRVLKQLVRRSRGSGTSQDTFLGYWKGSDCNLGSYWQALALEKLLLVTSTVAPNAAPAPRPALHSLPPVNENPQPPAGSARSDRASKHLLVCPRGTNVHG